MATAITHSIVGAAIVFCAPKQYRTPLNFIIASALGAIADLDVISFRLGIPYNSMFGHRGFTHSILVAFLVGLMGASIAYLSCKKDVLTPPTFRGMACIMILAALSHGILDAFTNGGHGVAFFSPFNNQRYFFPAQPIEVCNIGYNFFNERALMVLKSEFNIVILPVITVMICLASVRRFRTIKGAEMKS
jgi:inner membrane protein